MQKLEQRIHICRISSFCHWLKPATPMAADHESQACRKQKIHPKSGISVGLGGTAAGLSHHGATGEGRLRTLQGSPACRNLSTKWKELPCRMEKLCLPCFSWEKSGSCAMQWILSIDELISLENKPFSPRWDRPRRWAGSDGTGAGLGLLFPPPSALPSFPFSSWLINNGAVQNSQNLPRSSYKRRYSPLEKPV